jgi:hypothetical protein
VCCSAPIPEKSTEKSAVHAGYTKYFLGDAYPCVLYPLFPQNDEVKSSIREMEDDPEMAEFFDAIKVKLNGFLSWRIG